MQLTLYPCDGHAVSCTSGNTGDLRAQVITTPDLVVTQTFGYDSVGRLSTAAETPGASGQGTPTWSRGFGYDAKSNMWVSSDPGAAIPPLSPFTPTVSTNFDAQNRLLLQSAGYKDAGHQQAIGGFTSAFDAEGRMVSSTGTMSATYDYDGQGQRVRRKTVEPLVSGGHRDITTVYVYDATGNLAAEYESVTEYDQAGTPSPGTNPMSGAANPCGTSTCYVSVDQLGSTRMVTDSTGTVKRRYDYLPFGEEIATGIGGRAALMGYQANGDGFNPKFTGQVRDLESRLDYFNARYYSPEQGRFVSPDPGNAGADPAAPQTWNGYAYVGNNPVNLVDPNGESWITALFGVFGFIGGALSGGALFPWWYTAIMTGATTAGAHYSFEKAADSGNIAAIAAMFIGGPPTTDYAGLGRMSTGGVFGSGQTGPFIFSFEQQQDGIWTTDYKGGYHWVELRAPVTGDLKLKTAPRRTDFSVAGACAINALKDHMFGIVGATASGPLPKPLLGERAIGTPWSTLLSKLGRGINVQTPAPVFGPGALRTTNLFRGLGRIVAPAAVVINAGELLKTGQDAYTCYGLSH